MDDFVGSYDGMILSPHMRDLYGGSSFYNVGDWSRGARTLPEACQHLVERHLDPAPPHCRVLDVGCGLGAATEVVANHYRQGQVVAINISQRQAAYARTNHPGPLYSAMDAVSLGFRAEFFDRVISIEAAFHFRSRAAFLREAHRILRPGGKLILSDVLFRTAQCIGNWSVPDSNMLPDLSAYADLCRDCGFEVESLIDLTCSTWLGFCHFLRVIDGYQELAARLERSVHAYCLAHLRKVGLPGGHAA